MLRYLYPLAKLYWRLFPKVSLGTRIIAIRGDEVLLVKMTYLRDWYLPGGAVDQYETLAEAAARELLEETGWQAKSISFKKMYFDRRNRASNHIALFVTRNIEQVANTKSDHEIEKQAFFPMNALPKGLSPATRRRLDEYLSEQAECPEIW